MDDFQRSRFPGRTNRREFARRLAGLSAAAGLGGLGRTTLAGGDGAPAGLILRNSRPLDAETPVAAFDRFLTPNDLFFVRSHFGPPAVGLSAWALDIGGEVDRPFSLDEHDRAAIEPETVTAVLQCSGNGRAHFAPKLPGVGWDKGAVGNAEWSGVRLADLLKRAGVKEGAGHVHLVGADGPPSPKTPAYLRSIPIEKALDPDTLVAWKMNGEPLPRLHGGPLRLIVPGWAGNHWMKWLRKIVVARDEAPGFYQQTGYRMPKRPVPPGTDLKPADLVPVTVMNVKSLFATPEAGAVLAPGRREVRGVAWTGEGKVAKVEISVDGGPWAPAELIGPDRPHAWRLWKYAWDAAPPGRHTLAVRATDSLGQVQPEVTPWNKSGYLWNGIDRLDCEVRNA